MTPTPPSTNSSTHNSPHDDYRIIRKRNRVPLSCAPCRQRKLKCNRDHPCDNCIKRGEINSCTYASPVGRKKSVVGSPGAASPDEMQNRIDRLESLVLSLMSNGQPGAPAAAAEAIAQARGGSSSNSTAPASSISDGSQFGHRHSIDHEAHDDMIINEGDENDEDVANVAKSIGIMKVDGPKQIFISEAHWLSILGEITDFKSYFLANKKNFEVQMKAIQSTKEANQTVPSIFLFNHPPATMAEVRHSFPPKGTTDVLISRFFDVYNVDAIFRIIHGPTYQKQYNQHWLMPRETDVAWLALSYSMMMIALISFKRLRDEPPEYKDRTDQMYRDFRRLTGQCLSLMDINHPGSYTIEIFILYILAELAHCRDAESALMMGVTYAVRLAMKMGYHRDSKYFPDMTPFNGEMRRRVWSCILSSDLKISSQFGLPPMVRSEVCNTELPRNLYDDELDENMTVLPLSRPMTENTPIAYTIYKTQLITVCYNIIEETQKLRETSYDTIMELDGRLREIHENIPPHMRMRSLDSSIQTEQSSTILKRFMCEILYLKYLCLLHRKFAGMPRAEYSTRTCISSAMDILSYQIMLFDGLKPGGSLSDSKIFVTSLATHDFLLAAMIVSTHLWRVVEADRLNGIGQPDEQERERRIKMRYAVEESMKIWDSAKEDSLEALKATGALTAMLRMLDDQDTKIRRTMGGAGGGGAGRGGFYSGALPKSSNVGGLNMGMGGGGIGVENGNGMMRDMEPEHHAAMTLGMLSTGANPSVNGNSGANLFSSAFSDNNNNNNTVTANANANGGANAASFTSVTSPGSDSADPLSPFTSLFTSAGFNRLPAYNSNPSGSNTLKSDNISTGGWDLPNGVDWEAFDSYVNAGGLLDSANLMVPQWPVNFDPAMDPALTTGGSGAGTSVTAGLQGQQGKQGQQGQQGQQRGQQQGVGLSRTKSPGQAAGLGGNVFMGMNTPPRGNLI